MLCHSGPFPELRFHSDLAPDLMKAQIKARLDALPSNLAIVRRYREAPSPLVRQISGAPWRSGKLDAVLAGNFDLIARTQRSGEAR